MRIGCAGVFWLLGGLSALSIQGTASISPEITQQQGAQTTHLYFPRVVNTTAERTGIAIANLSMDAANLTFRAFNPQGELITGTGISNPATRRLEGSEQLAEVAFQIFGEGFVTSSAWVEVESDNSGVVGFYLFFDDAVNFLDGADAGGQTHTEMIFSETESVELNLANPNTAQADVSLQLVSDSGQTLARLDDIRIPGRGKFSGDLSALFPVLTQEFFEVPQRQGSKASLLLDSTLGIVGFSLLGDKDRFIAGLNAQAVSEGATRLFVPQYVQGGGFSTELGIVNLDLAAVANVTLQLVGEDGTQMGTTAAISIMPKGKVSVSDPGVFGLSSGGATIEGYIVVSSDGPRLAGSVIFGDPARTTFEAALPFVSRTQRDVVYSQVAQNSTFFTGAAIINLSDSPLTATIDVFDTGGRLVNTGTRIIAARGRDSFVLTELFPNLNISAGYFRVRSDQDMASFAIFGTSTLSALSAVPPQIIP